MLVLRQEATVQRMGMPVPQDALRWRKSASEKGNSFSTHFGAAWRGLFG
jgi:hypothetical protein